MDLCLSFDSYSIVYSFVSFIMLSFLVFTKNINIKGTQGKELDNGIIYIYVYNIYVKSSRGGSVIPSYFVNYR